MPKHEPEVVSLEARRRLRLAQTKAKSEAIQARKVRPTTGAAGERAINWRKVPLFIAALAALLAASWLIGKLTH